MFFLFGICILAVCVQHAGTYFQYARLDYRRCRHGCHCRNFIVISWPISILLSYSFRSILVQELYISRQIHVIYTRRLFIPVLTPPCLVPIANFSTSKDKYSHEYEGQ